MLSKRVSKQSMKKKVITIAVLRQTYADATLFVQITAVKLALVVRTDFLAINLLGANKITIEGMHDLPTGISNTKMFPIFGGFCGGWNKEPYLM